ncbi:MAG: hypothetical protein Q4F88_04445 [Eubacteriales bacterium]|nr:hypothetical protein [Eubacteriales bacterium]
MIGYGILGEFLVLAINVIFFLILAIVGIFLGRKLYFNKVKKEENKQNNN